MSGPIVPPLEVTEVDGSPDGRPITKIIVSNGDLSISGRTATIDTSGSGGTPAAPADSIQFNSDPAGTFTSDVGFTMATIGAGDSTKINVGGVQIGGTSAITSTVLNSTLTLTAEGTGQIILSNTEDGGGTWTDTTVKIMCWDNADESVLQFTNNNGTSKVAVLTLDGSSDFIIDNSNTGGDNGDVRLVPGNGDYITIGRSSLSSDGGRISTAGAYDLELSTNSGTNSGTITIIDGVNGNIELVPNGTGLVKVANLTVGGNYALPTDAGTDTYVMTTDGAGTASWAAAADSGGTVTSITTAADSGTGTAITTSGTFTFTGGTGVTTSVTGTTVTINADNNGTVTGTGADNQVALWNGTTALDGDTKLTWDGTDLVVDGTIKPTGVTVNGAYSLPTVVTTDNDFILTAQTDGSTAWAAAAGGASIMERGYKSATYYNMNPIQMYTQTIQALSANKVRCIPFLVNKTTTFDRIMAYGGSTSGTADLSIGLYNMGSDGEPSTNILTEEFTSITTGYHTATISQSLDAGWYFYFVWANESVEYGITNTNAGSLGYGLVEVGNPSYMNYGGSLRVFNSTYASGAAPSLASTNPNQIEVYNVNVALRAV